jgi:chemotaxis protein methyltransferase CheR
LTGPVIGEPEIDNFETEQELPALTKARDLANSGEIEKALEILIKLAEGAGRLDYRVHFLLAVVSDQSAKVDQAISSLKRAIFLDKGFVIGHYYLGVLYQREGNNKQASRFFNNAKKLLDEMDPDELLDEADGLTPERLKEIVHGRTEEIRFS